MFTSAVIPLVLLLVACDAAFNTSHGACPLAMACCESPTSPTVIGSAICSICCPLGHAAYCEAATWNKDLK